MLHHVAHGRLTQPLSDAEQAGFLLWAEQGGAPGAAVSALLGRLHRISPIGCDCRGPDDPPMACAVRLPSAELIVRWYGPRAHAASCVFQRQTQDRAPLDPKPRAGAAVAKPWTEGWDLLGPAIVRVRGRSTTPAPSAAGPDDATPRMPRLGRVLLSALQRTGYTRLSYTDLHRSDPTQPKDPEGWSKRIFRLLDEPVDGALLFKDTSAATLRQLAPWLATRLPAAAPQFRSLRPQGVLIGLASELDITGRQTRLVGLQGDPSAQATLDHPIRRFGPCRTGPWWVILQAAQAPGGGAFTVVDAYAHPAFSIALPIPVDSDAERGLLAIVLGQIKFWRTYPKTLAYVSLLKPVHDLETTAGFCRPDLLISFQDEQRRRHALAIECMGYDDPAYLERKVRTHGAMRLLPDVHGLFEYHPGALPSEDVRRSLTAALFAGARAAPPSSSAQTP